MSRGDLGKLAATIISLAAFLAASALPGTAAASFHENRISEVFPGTALCPDCSFVELQSYSAGQNAVTGHTIRSYGATGVLENTFVLPGGVPKGESQRTILIGDDSVSGRDFTNFAFGTNLIPAGGAVCFDAVDCVAWGNFTGLASLPVGSVVGAPAANPGGIPNGNSLVRTVAPGCSTLFELGDDTNDSFTDFTLTDGPTPRSNSVTPTEVACAPVVPSTAIDKGPKKKIKGKKAKFKFSSPDAGAVFECRMDKKAFKPCTSPKKLKRIKRGKHVFAVRAVLAGEPDPTPATYKFKRKKS